MPYRRTVTDPSASSLAPTISSMGILRMLPLRIFLPMDASPLSTSARTMLRRSVDCTLRRVLLVLLAHRNQQHLQRRQPGRERATVVLDQERDEALMGAQRRPVNAVGVCSVPSRSMYLRPKRPGTAKSSWLVETLNSFSSTLSNWKSTFGP